MISICHIIDRLAPGGLARQLCLIAPRLPRDRVSLRVVVLGESTPWVGKVREAGVPVDVLNWRRTFDARPLLQLPLLLREIKPDVVHAWGTTALRALVFTGSRRLGGIIATGALPAEARPSWIDRALLHRLAGVVALGEAEGQRVRGCGLAPQRVTILRAAVEASLPAVPPNAGGEGPRTLLLLGPLRPFKGAFDAVWTFDMVQIATGNLRLVIAGQGPDEARARALARHLRVEPLIQFTGEVDTVAPLIERASVVVVPCRRDGGRCATLEAMAAARPVVVARTPDLTELIEDDVSGLTFHPGDRMDMGKKLCRLLNDETLCARLGQTAQRRAIERHSPEALLEGLMRVYERG